ncbi:hypothetical protein [Rubinisphaera margarita]|uniref:hypothetical protein n=1 Tax=Rubinisphaera margarita TaxID=2909586 RepID=UPI001EE9AE5E|nr:hypothetical protein [Rubinisphaera margarita]MCG6156742.1 hypothetical protein [Rubinisphaera margarita]
MPRPITEAHLNHLLNFIGYGSLSASIWFLGMEEGGGGEANLRVRLQFEPVEDLERAHRLLGVTKFHAGRPVIQRTWRAMSYLMLRLQNRPADREAIRAYQAQELGRFEGDSLLVELMPIPKPRIGRWDYEELLPQFASREDYYRTVKPDRVQLLRELMEQHEPRLVVGYGKQFWPDYCELFPGMVVGEQGPFRVGQWRKTTVALTGHFTARSMNGQLEPLLDLVRMHCRLSFDRSPRSVPEFPRDW